MRSATDASVSPGFTTWVNAAASAATARAATAVRTGERRVRMKRTQPRSDPAQDAARQDADVRPVVAVARDSQVENRAEDEGKVRDGRGVELRFERERDL